MIKKFLQHHPVHKKIVPIFDLLFLLRPTMFFALGVMVVAGMISAKLNMHATSLWNTEFSAEYFFVFLGLTLIISAAFISIQISDVKSGQINQKLLIIGKYISVDKGKAIARILLISGGVISLIANWTTAIAVACIYILWGVEFNHVSFKWTKTPIAGWMINSLVGLLLFIIGWILEMKNYPHNGIIPLSFGTFSYMLPYLLCFSAVSLLTTFQDMKDDVKEGPQTFPNAFSSSRALLISLVMVSIALYVSLKHTDPLASSATLVSLPFFLFSAVRRLNKDIIRAIRYPILIINFFVLIYYPLLVVPIMFTYYLSKYYYWHRFNLHYPTFLVDND